MKRFLLAIFALGLTCSAFAQFSTFDKVTSTTDKVGIGTQSPISTLSVNGNFDVSNGGNILSYNGAADITFRFADRGAGGRAMVHDNGNMLVLNYNGDFTGGTMLGSNAYFTQSPSGSSFIQFGNVGIGTNQPNAKLDVQGGNFAVYSGAASFVSIGSAATGKTLLQLGTSADAGGYSTMQAVASSGSAWGDLMLNPSGGFVGIGTTKPDQMLSVKGTIHSQQVLVDMKGWGDFVFNPSYKLASLSSVKTYLDQNHHLPDMPSELEVIKNGINVGEMVKLQTQKIEQLTLYLIEKDQQLKDQTQEIKDLKDRENRSAQQETRIAALEKALEKLTAAAKK